MPRLVCRWMRNPRKLEALVYVSNLGLGLRQAQACMDQDRCCFVSQRLGVGSGVSSLFSVSDCGLPADVEHKAACPKLLTMLADTMMPEAFEFAGKASGRWCSTHP